MLFASLRRIPGRIFASVKLDLLETEKNIAARIAILMDFRMKVNFKCQIGLSTEGKVTIGH